MKKILLVCFSFALVFNVWAQDRVVSGKVTSAEDGSALPGVSVVLKGTTNGTVTDAEGNYKLTVVGGGGTLAFSFVGMTGSEVEIGERSVVDVSLGLDIKQLSEIVVTAQGISQEKKALGYAVSSVSGEQVQQRPEADVARMLNGKIPGMSITPTGGVSGTGTNIIIRGYTTITGNKQPLFVVDGVPFDGSTNQQAGFTGGNQTSTSRFLDLDPNNIDRVDVLKGLSAATLYGEAGRNGVILITTKNSTKSKGALSVTVNQSYFVNKIASLPELQNSYGGGFDQNYGPFFSNWGPRFSSRDSIPHPYSTAFLARTFPEFQGKNYKYQAFDNNKFFRDGTVINTSIGLNGGNENISYNVTIGKNNEQGFVPNNDLEKYNFGAGVTAKLSKKFNLSSSFNYASTDLKTPPLNSASSSGVNGNGSSVFANIFYTPRHIDLMGLPFESPIDRSSVYYRGGNDIQNPRWTAQNAGTTDVTKRIFGRTQLSYNVTDKFKLIYRIGLDTYGQRQRYFINKGGVDLPNGILRTTNIQNTIVNHDFLATYATNIGEKFSLDVTGGAQIRFDRYNQDGQESTNQIFFGVLNHSNFSFHSPINSFSGNNMNYFEEKDYYGVYAKAVLGYQGFLYLDLQGRNDWSSTLEKANNTLFYPSASLSFVPTEAFKIESQTLNYLKFRVGFGSSAGFPNPYSTRNTLGFDARSYVDGAANPMAANFASSRLGNPNLRAETQQEFEVGMEAKLLKNRISIDATYYRRNTINLITEVPIDPATGFSSTFDNLGKLRNEGVELALTGTPFQTDQFTWTSTINFFHYVSIVDKLGSTLKQIQIGEGFSNLGNFAIEGKAFNTILGTPFLRDASGNRIVSSGGSYITDQKIAPLGNPNPRFTTSFINTFTYKGFTLSAQFDYREGGAIYSATAFTLVGRGVTKDTDFDRDRTFILPGVKEDGSVNDIQVTSSDVYFTNFVNLASEAGIFDGTTIRLRELSLGYALPKNIVAKTPFKAISITASGQNLWFNAVNFPKYLNFDTDVLSTGVGNNLGFDYFTGPSSRRIGANLRLTF
jgi:TonB-linked SusC/RagA family outer membrane protein